jgi:hypothetical protein
MDSTLALQPFHPVPAVAEEAGLVSNDIDHITVNLVARVNAVSVTAEDMCLAAVRIQTKLRKGCDREARLRCLAQVFNGQEDKVAALNFRLEAMGRVVRSGMIRPWVLPNIVRDIVFAVAAKAPLLCTGKQCHFDQGSFVASVLELSHVDGHA